MTPWNYSGHRDPGQIREWIRRKPFLAKTNYEKIFLADTKRGNKTLGLLYGNANLRTGRDLI